ncbi:hypothetical protein A2957_03495 [Candidatus Roizmanbacteria bacterium RIFCSPLOWO2_01_FULL_38_11]|uniref:DUF1648 domain-containing protein n=1 Tax=Candidatus Roizmanbacteria bacterium RIFCSPLOWO2_01_FULL_38_11 TaxID=1802060 RepID=A0A1F7IPK6_9BACT|nr:MAG: hypothetical protein A2957_03495 [Candidatus Roizmanbacteria bacterium RIFCSPLOWO2_01_FULL_38_11]
MKKNIFTTKVNFSIALILMLSFFLLRFSSLPPEIPFFYSLPEPSKQLSQSYVIIMVPILMGLLIAINTFIERKFFNGAAFVKRVIFITNTIVIIIFTYVFIRIILLVT